jgi:hypothetical protein
MLKPRNVRGFLYIKFLWHLSQYTNTVF